VYEEFQVPRTPVIIISLLVFFSHLASLPLSLHYTQILIIIMDVFLRSLLLYFILIIVIIFVFTYKHRFQLRIHRSTILPSTQRSSVDQCDVVVIG
jgi:hypothetical protein